MKATILKKLKKSIDLKPQNSYRTLQLARRHFPAFQLKSLSPPPFLRDT
jgi:hypothetical protein